MDNTTNSGYSSAKDLVNQVFSKARSFWFIYIIFIILSFALVATANSQEVYKSGLWKMIFKHALNLAFGFSAAVVVSQIALSQYRKKIMIWGCSLLMLGAIVVLLLAGTEINGAKRWIDLKIFYLQPSEFFKLYIILAGAFLAHRAERFKIKISKTKDKILSGEISKKSGNNRIHAIQKRINNAFWGYWIVLGLGAALLGKDNLSSFIMLLIFMFIYALIIGMPRPVFRRVMMIGAIIGAIFGGAILFAPNALKSIGLGRASTWHSRIVRMMDKHKEVEPYAIGKNDLQEKYGKIALSNSKLLGVGIGKSRMRDLLPMASSDFIFAIIVEETGLLGIIGIPALYIAFFVMCYRLALKERTVFRRTLIMGIGLYYPMQALINIMVVSGWFMTGQQLPFISAGGSSFLSCSIAMGILIGIARTQENAIEIERTQNNQSAPQTNL